MTAPEERDVPAGRRRAPSPGEEIASSVSHGIGLAVALVAVPVLVLSRLGHEDPVAVVGAAVFGATVLLLYLASMLYHALPPGPAKRRWRVLDHQAIFLLIAGSYTPFMLGALRGAWGWTLLVLVWSGAIAGVALKAVRGVRHPWLSVALYLGLGWLILIAFRPMSSRMAPAGLAWLAAGGLAYTAGLIFFAASRMRYSHLVWHVFVLAGTTCHFLAVLWYAAG